MCCSVLRGKRSFVNSFGFGMIRERKGGRKYFRSSRMNYWNRFWISFEKYFFLNASVERKTRIGKESGCCTISKRSSLPSRKDLEWNIFCNGIDTNLGVEKLIESMPRILLCLIFVSII